MALSTHQQRTLSDREYNSNYLNKRISLAKDDFRESVNGNGKLSKTASTRNLPTSKSATKVFLSYNNTFTDNAPTDAKRNSHYHYDNLSLCFSEHSYDQTQLLGGANRNQQKFDKLISSPSQCRIPATGLDYFDPKNQANIVHLKLSDSHTNSKCPNRPLPHVTNSNARGTQTLYRDSGAQTLPYLPGVINDLKELETLELFKLPTILPGDGPPGLFEVDVLARARKRWAFAKALKENLRKQLQEAREQAKLRQHSKVLEAFEWEHWIEREEDIQECQMLRLEILIRMFDEREQQMKTASMDRIEKSYEIIESRKQAALKKNEIAHARALRRLEIKHAKQPRVWRKEHISQELGDPSSEFYAPKMRNGVNPSRRHFHAYSKDFNMRMDNLKKTAVKMDYKHLSCPYAKLREWSTPKVVVQEVERNFCSEGNLKNVFKSLKALRESTTKQKTAPLCLKPKVLKQLQEIQIEDEVSQIEPSIISLARLSKDQEEADHRKSMAELRRQTTEERHRIQMIQKEMRCEELEILMNSYEGNTIGWLMRFLSQEMCRLMEQRKLQFFTMVAKRERWHREAAEAGLRQKENFLRQDYAHKYDECSQTNMETAEKFFNDIIGADILDSAQEKAEDEIQALARDMDKEITGWLESFREVQNSLNYESLRYALLNIFMPDKKTIIYRKERDDCIQYIINDVLFPNVYRLLETYDISFALTSDFVDRLIDNDICLNSSDCGSECACECTEFCTCSNAQHEALAVIRKVIRRSVPGRRWRTSNELIAFENIQDLLDEVFDVVRPKGSVIEVDMKTSANVCDQIGHTDLVDSEHDVKYSDTSEKCHSEEGSMFKVRTLGSFPIDFDCDIIKDLRNSEKLLLLDPDTLSADHLLIHCDEYIAPKPKYEPTTVHEIPSTHDITSTVEFSKTLTYNQTSSDEFMLEEEEQFTKSESEYTDEMKRRTEEWALEMSSFNEEYEKEHNEFNDDTVEEEKKFFVQTLDSSLHFGENPKEIIIIPEQTYEIASDKAGDDDDDHGEDDDDNDDDGIIPVTFSYDPSINYSRPIPSNSVIADDTEVIKLEHKSIEIRHK